MEFIAIPTEQTTAVTDLLLSLVAGVGAFYIYRLNTFDAFKAKTWSLILGLLCIAALVGAVMHGFVWSSRALAVLNHGLSLSLGLLMAIFVIAVAYDLFGLALAKRLLPIMLVVALGFFMLRLFWSGSFLVFIIYQSLAMLFALAGYCWLVSRKQKGAALVALGVLTTLIAAAVQALQLFSFTLVWAFDHNGSYHLIQLLAVILFLFGLRRALADDNVQASNNKVA